MRLTEFASKRIINLYDGGILGTVGESDLIIDPLNGVIDAIILPSGYSFAGFRSKRNTNRQITIPWETVKKIGAEVIVIDMEDIV